jgi:hypothetical protein
MRKSAIVIAGFPGIGKSWFIETRAKGKRVADLEPSSFKCGKDQSGYWPSNYLTAVRQAMAESDIVLIATYPEIITTLVVEGVALIIVYPDSSQSVEYEQRYRARGNHERIIEILIKNFKSNVENLVALDGCKHVVLKPGQYLSDVIGEIV